MNRNLFSISIVLALGLTFSFAIAQPTLIPPVVVGPKTLTSSGGNPPGFYQYLTQGNGNGNIKGIPDGIAAGDTFWVYVVGIDATGVTGAGGRTMKFNLQDSESGSQFKHLGVSFALQSPASGGGDLLSCYQSTDDESEQAFGSGVLTNGDFDLRFRFSKPTSGAGWTIVPYYRLSGGGWTQFFDGPFTPGIAFDFLGAKLVVSFENGAAGQVSFDNYFVLGPISNPDTLFVDDDWAGLAEGDAVQFPSEIQVRVIGVNAFATIQAAVNEFNPTLATKEFGTNRLNVVEEEQVVRIAPGTYNENVAVNSRMKIIGSGSGSNEEVDTIISSDEEDTPVIRIDGVAATGSSVNSRMEVHNVRVTGATGSASLGSGILVDDGNYEPDNKARFVKSTPASVTITQYLHFNNVTAVNNSDHGIAFEHDYDVQNISVNNCNLSNNGDFGFYITPDVNIFNGLQMTGGQINNNGRSGINTGGSPGITNINVDGTTFSGNGNTGELLLGAALKSEMALQISGPETGDIMLPFFNGNATIENITITGDNANAGIYMAGGDFVTGAIRDTGVSAAQSVQAISTPMASGTVSFNNVTITGTYQDPVIGEGAGIYLAYYSAVSGISFNNVQINVSDVDVVNLLLENLTGALNVGNTTFGGNAGYDILNLSPVTVDADAAVFTGATSGGTDNFLIEDRVTHTIDNTDFGLVTWVPNNVYLTLNSFYTPNTAPTIRRAITAASLGGTINVSAGTFLEEPRVIINKSVDIKGQGSASTIFQASNNSVDNAGDNRAWFSVSPNYTARFFNMKFDGNEYTLYEGIRMRGQGALFNVAITDINAPAYDGIGIFVNSDGKVDVTNCTFSNIGRTGVHYTTPDANGSVYRGNTYSGKGSGNHLDFAVEVDDGTHVRIVSSTISNNLGSAQGVTQIRSDAKTGLNGVLGTILVTEQSAGIRITTVDGLDTEVTVDSTEIYSCVNGIFIGLDATDDSFVLVRNSELHTNTNGLYATSAQFLKVEDSKIYSNSTAILLNSIPAYDLENNDIYGNNVGVSVSTSFGEIDDCQIYENGNGVIVEDQESTGITIINNEFCSSGGYAVQNFGTSTVAATGNWWGAANGPGGAGPGDGDDVSAGVNFASFKTAPIFQDSQCNPPEVWVQTKIFLEGPFNSGTGLMNDFLGANGHIPLTSPYLQDARTVTSIPDNVVDWVLVELRQPIPNQALNATGNGGGPYAVGWKSAFLNKDGRIVADDGATGYIAIPVNQQLGRSVKELNQTQTYAPVTAGGDYYIVIHHRNHLAIMSANTVSLSYGTSTLYNFTTGQNKAYGTNAMKNLGSGKFGLLSGDGDGDGDVDASDKDEVWRPHNGGVWNYLGTPGDFDMDGDIDAVDINQKWRPNNGLSTQVPSIPSEIIR